MKKLFVSIFAIALLAGCGAKGSDEDKNLVIGASTTPHAEILKHIKPVLEKEGYKVTIKEFTDYVKPNQGLVDGDLDANYFQHKPYLLDWAKKAGKSKDLTSVLAVHFEPMGIYSSKYKSLDDIKDGATIAIPNDPTNGGRALQLLADHGIITLKDGAGVNATKADITKNNKNIVLKELQAEACATNIGDVDFSVINANNALNAKLEDKLIVTEKKDGDLAKTYGNVIAVRTKDKDSPKIKALVKALNTEDVKKFIDKKYKGVIIPLVPTK